MQHPFLPFARISIRQGTGAVLLGLGLVLPAMYAIGLILPTPSATASNAYDLRVSSTFINPLSTLLRGAFIYPVLEEIVFRGLLLQLCRRYLHPWTAVAISSLLFALTHLRPDMTLSTPVFALLSGVLFSWLVIRTESLLASILCHAAINFSLWFVINPILMTQVSESFPAAIVHPVSLGLLGGLAAVLVLGITFLKTDSRCATVTCLPFPRA